MPKRLSSSSKLSSLSHRSGVTSQSLRWKPHLLQTQQIILFLTEPDFNDAFSSPVAVQPPHHIRGDPQLAREPRRLRRRPPRCRDVRLRRAIRSDVHLLVDAGAV